MSDFNKQQFLDSLPEGIRAKLAAAGSNDELLALADENDVELPVEALSGVSGGFGMKLVNNEACIEIGDQWFTQEEYRSMMWTIYDKFGYDATLAFMNTILPTYHNKIWLDGNVNYYVDCLFAKVDRALRGVEKWDPYSIQ